VLPPFYENIYLISTDLYVGLEGQRPKPPPFGFYHMSGKNTTPPTTPGSCFYQKYGIGKTKGGPQTPAHPPHPRPLAWGGGGRGQGSGGGVGDEKYPKQVPQQWVPVLGGGAKTTTQPGTTSPREIAQPPRLQEEGENINSSPISLKNFNSKKALLSKIKEIKGNIQQHNLKQDETFLKLASLIKKKKLGSYIPITILISSLNRIIHPKPIEFIFNTNTVYSSIFYLKYY
jgi:hypothetical protein